MICSICKGTSQSSNIQYDEGSGVLNEYGNKFWYQNDQLHRVDGPAAEYSNGDKFWYQNGERHRLDGPACEWSDGSCLWYINGEQLTEEEFLNRTK